MSSPGAVRLYGSSKTYGRARESVASRSFDEMMSGKPGKASAAHTKWGNTNYVRDRKKTQKESPKSRDSKMHLDDPFSFDTDEKGGKSSPTKGQPSPVPADFHKHSTRLPASRIFTQGQADDSSVSIRASPLQEPDSLESSYSAIYQRNTPGLPAARVLFSQGKGDESVSNPRNSIQHSSDSNTNLCAIARPGRTYTRSHEGRIKSSPTKHRLLDPFLDVGKSVKKELGVDVLCSMESHRGVPSQMAPRYVASSLSPLKSPQKLKVDHNISSPFDDSSSIFPASYNPLVGSYPREPRTNVSSGFYDPPVKKLRLGSDSLGVQEASSASSVAEDYRAQCWNSQLYSDHPANVSSSVLSQQHRGNKDVLPQHTSKSKLNVWEEKDNSNYQCMKSARHSGESTCSKTALSAASSGRLSISSSGSVKSLPNSQETSSVRSTSRQTKVIDVDDENFFSPANTTGLRSVLSTKNHPAGDASKFVKDRSFVRSSQLSDISKSASSSSTSSSTSISSKLSGSSSSSSSSSSTNANNKNGSAAGGSRRMQSGVKQYRIFKSRRPAQSPPKPGVEEEEVAPSVRSPAMPELDLELPEVFGRKENHEELQTPPDITDQEKTDDEVTEVDSPQASQEQEPAMSGFQSSQLVKGDPEVDVMDVDEFLADSPTLQLGSLDSQEVPSPASVDSQELSQDALSSASNSQKEEDVPAAPRRFFKSRKTSGALGLQRKVLKKTQSKASYNARSWHQDENDKEADSRPAQDQRKEASIFEEEEEESPFRAVKEPRIVRSVHWSRNREQPAYTSIKVNSEHKELYMVVQNVKMAHEVQESGETQDFIDDLEYLLDNLHHSQPLSIRALSTIQLAGKCTLPAFRMHLRAHGTVTKIFSLLHDACSFPSLALSTAALMFMLSQDRLNMDLDRDSLHLMLKLNEVDMPRSTGGPESSWPEEEASLGSAEDSAELEKCRHRVQDLMMQLQKESTAARNIDVDSVSTGNLAMESLLSLTSRRAGEWFKEELRTLGGLDHFVQTVHHCVSGLKGDLSHNLDTYTPGLKKLDRCLRVLENITFMNTDNQAYIIAYSQGLLISATSQLLHQCVVALPLMPLQEADSEAALQQQRGWLVFQCLLAVLRVLLNLTHDSEFGCTRVGQEAGVLPTVLQCVINIQWCVPPDMRFDVLVLSLGLLINLMEQCPVNRRHLLRAQLTAQITEEDVPRDMDAVQALVQLFLQRESTARQMEETTDSAPVRASQSSSQGPASESGIDWIARSAEKVRAAEKQQRDLAGEGSSRSEEKKSMDSQRPADSASIQEDEENFTKALHKAGKHMENSIVASYVGLLLGCVIQDNSKYTERVRQHLPDGSFQSMIHILKKFLGFMSLTTAIGSTDADSIQRVIDTLEAC